MCVCRAVGVKLLGKWMNGESVEELLKNIYIYRFQGQANHGQIHGIELGKQWAYGSINMSLAPEKEKGEEIAVKWKRLGVRATTQEGQIKEIFEDYLVFKIFR